MLPAGLPLLFVFWHSAKVTDSAGVAHCRTTVSHHAPRYSCSRSTAHCCNCEHGNRNSKNCSNCHPPRHRGISLLLVFSRINKNAWNTLNLSAAYAANLSADLRRRRFPFFVLRSATSVSNAARTTRRETRAHARPHTVAIASTGTASRRIAPIATRQDTVF